MKYFLSPIFLIFILANSLSGQNQNIRGQIIDIESKQPIIGANVLIIGSNPLLGASTYIDGYFTINEVSLGRVNLSITSLGYEDRIIPNLLITAGKEVVLEIEMEESVLVLDEVVVTAGGGNKSALNEMATLSSRSFTVEETGKYAAGFFDPARIAQNFAGVTIAGGEDLFNEIVIRGNSPRGVLWRLEGIEIPNPNHFSSLGSSGGAISMLSSSTLSASDFYTGAFPSEFGNAYSGAFDLRLRNGNNTKREYAFMLGALGVEAALEGPFSSNSKSSYLINYRYSTLGLLTALDLSPTGEVLPKYSDLSFKLNFPMKKGNLSFFGLGGINTAAENLEKDTSAWEPGETIQETFIEKQQVGTVGASYMHLFDNDSYIKTTAIYSHHSVDEKDNIVRKEELIEHNLENGLLTNDIYRISSVYTNKLSARATFRAGAIFSHTNFDFLYQERDNENENMKTFLDDAGGASTLQSFAHYKHKFNQKLTLNSGVHYTRFLLNDNHSIEPRVALEYQVNNKHTLGASFGIHSRPEHPLFYFAELDRTGQGIDTNPNKNVDFTKARHYVLSHDWRLGNSLRLKTEAYYQELYDVAVLPNDPYASMINATNAYSFIGEEPAISTGKGKNIGLDLTLEKFLSKGMYYMFTASIYDSKFQPSNGEWYNTRYNANYQAVAIGGKEWKVGKNKIFSANLKLIYAGGNRVSPIDLNQSRAAGYTIRDRSKYNEEQLSSYFRPDIGLSYKINKKRLTHSISLDIQNFIDYGNVLTDGYNPISQSIDVEEQSGLFPNFNYRIEF